MPFRVTSKMELEHVDPEAVRQNPELLVYAPNGDKTRWLPKPGQVNRKAYGFSSIT